jgi:hypothetical protein
MTLFSYYRYVETFHRDPNDIEDWLDGIAYMNARNEIDALRPLKEF